MFYHLKIILRNMRRNFTYSGINIAGLAIGITASVLIFMWVYHERSFDTCYPDTERIYRIINKVKYEDDVSISSDVSLPFIQACEREIPEMETIAVYCFMQQIRAVTVNNRIFSVKEGEAAGVNKTWLEMFHSQLLDGSFEAYGNHPFSVVLTESGAKKYFGDERAVGQIVRIEDTDYTVQAVVKDNPSNSSFRFHLMASTEAILSNPGKMQNLKQWGWCFWMTFVKLHPDTDISQVTQKMNDIYAKNNIENLETNLELLGDVYFSDIKSSTLVSGNAKMVSIFALLGILLLCTASINYINLTTAKTTQKAKDVGLRKIVGAKRRGLILYFIAESFIISLVATMIAFYFIKLLIPLYQQLVGDIPVSFSSPEIWIIAGIVLAIVTIMNSIYPALVLSSFQPINIFKGMSLSKIKDSTLRRVLIVFQFTLSAALVISVIVIFKQTQFILKTDPGFRKDNIVRVQLPFNTLFSSGQENVELSLQTIKGKLQSYPDVVSVSLCEGNIENAYLRISESADWSRRAEDFNPWMNILKVDEVFMDVFELQLTEGRWFDGDADMQNVILNETAIRELKIPEPYIGERFDLMGMKGSIIGIVKDFHFKSRHEKITPLVIYYQDPFKSVLAIKTQTGKSAEVVREMETIWGEFFPNDPLEYTFVDDAFNHLYKSDIRTSRLMLVFSILAIVIAVLGLFGLSTFAIERRAKEIAIRKLFGASISSIINMLTREFLVLVAIAFVIAAPVSFWAMSLWLDNFAYRIPFTVYIFVAGAVVTLVIALIAIGIQTVKAAVKNPVEAIKSE